MAHTSRTSVTLPIIAPTNQTVHMDSCGNSFSLVATALKGCYRLQVVVCFGLPRIHFQPPLSPRLLWNLSLLAFTLPKISLITFNKSSSHGYKFKFKNIILVVGSLTVRHYQGQRASTIQNSSCKLPNARSTVATTHVSSKGSKASFACNVKGTCVDGVFFAAPWQSVKTPSR